MIKFETLELAVYMAEEFRAGRYGFILFNPELKVFGIIGPFKKNEKYIFTPSAATYSFIKYAKYIASAPARSCVAVKALPKGALVEVEVIAKIN